MRWRTVKLTEVEAAGVVLQRVLAALPDLAERDHREELLLGRRPDGASGLAAQTG